MGNYQKTTGDESGWGLEKLGLRFEEIGLEKLGLGLEKLQLGSEKLGLETLGYRPGTIWVRLRKIGVRRNRFRKSTVRVRKISGESCLSNLNSLFSISNRDCYNLRINNRMLSLPKPNTNATKKFHLQGSHDLEFLAYSRKTLFIKYPSLNDIFSVAFY